MASQHRQDRRAKIDWLVTNRASWESIDLNGPASNGLINAVVTQMRTAGLYEVGTPIPEIAWGVRKMMLNISLPAAA
jgi:hypothetical protein